MILLLTFAIGSWSVLLDEMFVEEQLSNHRQQLLHEQMNDSMVHHQKTIFFFRGQDADLIGKNLDFAYTP